MLQIIKKLLLKVVDDIDSGNSELSQQEMGEVVDLLQRYNFRDKHISKYQAYTYLNISRATFDNMVRAGIIPKGVKEAGFKELRWNLSDIQKIAKDKSININN